MTAKSGTAWGISFTTNGTTPGIDAWGNLYQTSTISGTAVNAMPLTQTINVKNQFTASGYTYDAAGNVLADGSGITTCGGNAYTWNAEEQMSCAAGATYLYDGDGIRVGKSGGAASPTLYWGAGTLAESDTSGNVTSEYVFLGGKAGGPYLTLPRNLGAPLLAFEKWDVQSLHAKRAGSLSTMRVFPLHHFQLLSPLSIFRHSNITKSL